MSLDKSITHGKEHRRPCRDAKTIAKSCRNHGDCEWCRWNRTYKNDKRELHTLQELNDYLVET